MIFLKKEVSQLLNSVGKKAEKIFSGLHWQNIQHGFEKTHFGGLGLSPEERNERPPCGHLLDTVIGAAAHSGAGKFRIGLTLSSLLLKVCSSSSVFGHLIPISTV